MWYLPYQLVTRTFSIYSIKGLCQKPHSQHRELTKLPFSGSFQSWWTNSGVFKRDVIHVIFVISTGYVEELKSRWHISSLSIWLKFRPCVTYQTWGASNHSKHLFCHQSNHIHLLGHKSSCKKRGNLMYHRHFWCNFKRCLQIWKSPPFSIP